MKLRVQDASTFVATGGGNLSRPAGEGERKGDGDGDGKGRDAVLFVHGAGMDHTVWTMPARYFARQGCHVLAPDLPGHGRSAGKPLATVEAMAGWLVALLDACGAARVRVVGHSMGSLVALVLAARYPERVAGVVMLGASLPMPVAEGLLSAAADDDHAAFAMANTWSHSARGAMGGNAIPGLFVLNVGERLMERCGPGVFHADLAACNDFDPAGLPPVTAPVTVVVGTEDRMTPMRAGLEVAAGLGGTATVRVLPGCGHSMMWECPNQVLDLLVEAVQGGA